jgi:hypothetical protein
MGRGFTRCLAVAVLLALCLPASGCTGGMKAGPVLEYVVVTSQEPLFVLVDGVPSGVTNQVLRTSTGLHGFSVVAPDGTALAAWEVEVARTSPIAPLELSYVPE